MFLKITTDKDPHFLKGQIIKAEPAPSWCWSAKENGYHAKDRHGYDVVVLPADSEEIEIHTRENSEGTWLASVTYNGVYNTTLGATEEDAVAQLIEALEQAEEPAEDALNGEFTRYEYQYILMLAGRAKQEMEKDVKEDEEKWGNIGDPNPVMREYRRNIKHLQSIVNKAGLNMKRHDRRTSSWKEKRSNQIKHALETAEKEGNWTKQEELLQELRQLEEL